MQFTLVLTIALVVMVIFLFLRNVTATHHPGPGGAGLPRSARSAACTCSAITIDNLSLMALTLSVGFVVDDAIVMLENIVRHVEKGKTALDGGPATARARSASPFVSMTISLVAVFIPVLFMGGIVGRLFREFAVTICRRHPDFRPGLADPDADALQPLAASRIAGRASHGVRLSGSWKRLRLRC